MATAVERWRRIDILHNNVGVSIAGGDKPLEAAFDPVSAILADLCRDFYCRAVGPEHSFFKAAYTTSVSPADLGTAQPE